MGARGLESGSFVNIRHKSSAYPSPSTTAPGGLYSESLGLPHFFASAHTSRHVADTTRFTCFSRVSPYCTAIGWSKFQMS